MDPRVKPGGDAECAELLQPTGANQKQKPGCKGRASSYESNKQAAGVIHLPPIARNLLNFEIFRGLFAAIGNDFVLNVLTFVERAQPGPLHSGDVNEHILAAALRLDKAVTLCRVEPLHSACSHYQSPRIQKNESLPQMIADTRVSA